MKDIFFEPIFLSIECPTDDWQKFDGNCYYISDTTTTWKGAEEKCGLLGGHMAAPTTSENNQYIYEAIKDRNIPTVWIGVHRVGKKYHTVHGGEITFNKWLPGEPSGDGDCVELINRPLWNKNEDAAGSWNDLGCSYSDRYYICQRLSNN